MLKRRYIIGCLAGLFFSNHLQSQRTYAAHSVLATGNWYKLSVKATGVYKIDIPFLSALGVNTSGLSSGSVRLFGNGGHMLPEANADLRIDDLKENAIQVVDGGDGMINGNDYLLFYASGPDEWIKDSVNSRFSHRKNLYSDKSYFFLHISSGGKRIAPASIVTSPNLVVTGFSERNFHELDTVNFLSSGKEWYGEELSNIPGRTLNRNFSLSSPNTVAGSPCVLKTNCVARSIGTGSRFDVKLNNQLVSQLSVNAVSGGQYDLFAQQSTAIGVGHAAGNNFDISFTYLPGSFNSQGWINWFELFNRRSLSLNGVDQLLFRDWNSVGSGNRAEFVISNASASVQVWDITDPLTPLQMQGTLTGTDYKFVNNASRLREYVAFSSNGFLLPVAIGRLSNQDLHNTAPADMLIITHSSLLAQAQRLAQIHQQANGLRTKVVSTDEIFNEFGSGNSDPVALRDFVKMYYDKYRASTTDNLKYLLLFGDASFDYRDRLSNNTNLVPAYENNFSLDVLSTYASDDFFGFLDDNEDINSGVVTNLLDVGIGRVPAKNINEAKNFVDKVQSYVSSQSLGPWRNNFTFIADDEDNNLHLQDAEILTSTAGTTAPFFNQQKIYLDAFQQESGPGGSRYPQANLAINNQVNNGVLIWNYSGHGGASRLAEETILDQQTVSNWNNTGRLPLFITATCDFAPYDNPLVNSIGENLLLRPQTGGIALMTTTRVVFAFSNRIMNNNYLQAALQPGPNGSFKSLGDAVKEAKNFTYQTSGDMANNRKFTLLGDPALHLAFPAPGIRITKVNDIPANQADTLSTTEKATIEGEIIDAAGNIQTGFNGNLFSSVFDKPQLVNTRGNDPGSPVTGFQSQVNLLYKGRTSVSNGRFSFSFKVPRDINFQYGNGRLSLYAENGTKDVNGLFSHFIVGGAGTGSGGDITGPQIKIFLNDELFVSGGICNQTPVLLVKLSDSSGINITGSSIGHDIVATVDDDNRQFYILNDFFQGDLNSFQSGSVRFQLPQLEAGRHTLKLKAWDVLNNSSEAGIEFMVINDEQLEVKRLLNYPNPFTTKTRFMFEHNKPGQGLDISLQIMTVAGRVIKTINQSITPEGNRVEGPEWDGRDEFGDKLGRGVYIYRLRVKTQDGKKKEVMEKLVIL
jgi:hypothetical protein